MTKMLAVYMLVMAAFIGFYVLVNYLRGRDDLLSLRNFFLGGFIIFQLTSAVGAMWTQYNNRYTIMDWESTTLTFSAMATVFLALFLINYRLGLGATKLARLLPTTSAAPGFATILMISILLTVLAGVFRLSVNVPLISAVASKVGASFAAVACGFIAWSWAKQIFNPFVAAIAIAIILVNLALMVSGAFGRRNIVAIGACVLWAMYFSNWRYLPPWKVLVRLGIAALPPVLLLAAFTSVRSSQERPSLGQQVTALATQSDVRYGLAEIAAGQNTAPGSFWLIENYPERYEYKHLLALKYFFVLPVPRTVWKDKPYPLSTTIAADADLEGVSQDVLKVGPGVVGHAAAEGGWYALIVYGFAVAFFLRFFDSVALLRPDNPFVVLPIGAAAGQIVGLPRGEMSAFAMNYVLGVVLAYFALVTLAKGLELLGWRKDEPVAEDWGEYDDEYEDEDEGADGYGRGDAA